ncbi:hypothetical protein B0H10DRAFT_2223461 [Mycena sp. CBHHK59/15]|nr:hypothetical protein B0H10DRAFT_2223461 [Mycena sp. CBHHK59/15]
MSLDLIRDHIVQVSSYSLLPSADIADTVTYAYVSPAPPLSARSALKSRPIPELIRRVRPVPFWFATLCTDRGSPRAQSAGPWSFPTRAQDECPIFCQSVLSPKFVRNRSLFSVNSGTQNVPGCVGILTRDWKVNYAIQPELKADDKSPELSSPSSPASGLRAILANGRDCLFPRIALDHGHRAPPLMPACTHPRPHPASARISAPIFGVPLYSVLRLLYPASALRRAPRLGLAARAPPSCASPLVPIAFKTPRFVASLQPRSAAHAALHPAGHAPFLSLRPCIPHAALDCPSPSRVRRPTTASHPAAHAPSLIG